MKVLIVGGVAGGASAAARLRRLSETAEIILFERGEYISFANCGLPYYVGGTITSKDELTLQTPESFNTRFNIDVRVFSEVVGIDKENNSVTVHNIKTQQTYQESYDKLILAPGAKPIVPNLPGIDNPRAFTIRNIPDTYAISDFIAEQNPKSAVVVGGGFIGVEMAENLRQKGLTVSMVEMQDHVIASLDFDMACQVHTYLQKKGVALHLNSAVQEIRDVGNQLQVVLPSQTLDADMVLLAVGVSPDTKIAKDAGLAVNKRGGIVVDSHMLTSQPNIYAVGDAVEVTEFVSGQKTMIPLAGPANKQGRIAADNICGLNSEYKGTQGSAILKIFDMTAASTGITEKAAQALGLPFEKSFTFSSSHAGYYPGASSMCIKTIFDKTNGKILGAQIVGRDGVDKRCDVLAVAIRAGMSAADLTELELCYAPPYSSAKDPVNFAGYVIENILSRDVKIFHWHEVDALQKNSNVTLLDVQNPKEHQNGHIDGAVNIQLDELRQNLHKLDVKKPVYVHCFSGQRSYLACCILVAHGFDCYNLSGGYRLYRSITAAQKAFGKA